MICVICDKLTTGNHKCNPADVKKWEQHERRKDDRNEQRLYGQRLDEGFRMLSDSFGDFD